MKNNVLQIESITLDEFSEIIKKSLESIIYSTSLNENKNDNLLTRKETAIKLQISLVTLSEWSKRGFIKSHKIGSRVRYRESDVEKALNEVKTLKYTRG